MRASNKIYELLCAAVLALSVGLGAALMRVNHFFPTRLIGTLHVELFRNAPDYVMLVWVHFVLPLLIDVLPTNWGADVVRWLPTSAGGTIISTTGAQGHNLFAPWGQLAVTAGYAVILLIIGATLFRKRDA